MEEYELHSGITIPNIDNKNTNEIGVGVFAIERNFMALHRLAFKIRRIWGFFGTDPTV
jgi:hypothetical protein